MTPERAETLKLLASTPNGATLGEVAQHLNVSSDTAAGRLRVLRHAGLVTHVGNYGRGLRWCLVKDCQQAEEYWWALTKRPFKRGTEEQQAAARRRKGIAPKREQKPDLFVHLVVPAGHARRIRIPSVNSVWALAAA